MSRPPKKLRLILFTALLPPTKRRRHAHRTCHKPTSLTCLTLSLGQVTNLLWGLSLQGCLDTGLWAALHGHLAALGMQAHELPEEALTQVFQVCVIDCVRLREMGHASAGTGG